MASKAEIQAQVDAAVKEALAEQSTNRDTIIAEEHARVRSENLVSLRSQMGPDRDITDIVNEMSHIDPTAARGEDDPVGNSLVFHITRAICDLTGRKDAFKTVLRGYLHGMNSIGTITAYGDADVLLKLLPVAIQNKLEEQDKTRALEFSAGGRQRGSNMKTTVTVALIRELTKLLSDNGEEDMVIHPLPAFNVCEFVNHQQTQEEAEAQEKKQEIWAERKAKYAGNKGGAQQAGSMFANLMDNKNKMD